jgi:GNAT superfamily N-acetyltransferase
MELTTFSTHEASESELSVLREMLESSFASYSESAWEHCLGGTHFVLRYRGQLVSHLAVIPRYIAVDGVPLNAAYVESMATLPEFWGRRFGTALLSAASAHIIDAYDIGALSTRRVDFYQRAGWRVWVGRTLVRKIAEIRPANRIGTLMVILPLGSELSTEGEIATAWRSGDIW